MASPSSATRAAMAPAEMTAGPSIGSLVTQGASGSVTASPCSTMEREATSPHRSPKEATWPAAGNPGRSSSVHNRPVDQPTVQIYEEVATCWQAARGGPKDDLGLQFRAEVGSGLVVHLGRGTGRYLAQLA